MSAMWANAVGVMIVILMLTFIGIWVWAWLPFHKGNFDRLARLPMNDGQRVAVDDGERR
jgi:cytochrome c oxidase cbb3-type subunit 4